MSAVLVGLPLFAAAQTAQPSRDSSARPVPAAGTAVIRGRVLAGDTGKPLRRARITANAPELTGQSRTTSTDADGRYELADLPAGHYNLRVERGGYLTVQYGQRRPFERGTLLDVADTQTADNIDFSMPRMGLITGRITDENNEPIEGVNVYALRSMYFNGRRQFVPVGGAQVRTDDDGSYRLRALAPGMYLVQAITRETWTVNHDGQPEVMGYEPSFYPSTAAIAQARRVTVPLGREISGIDFSIVPGRAATLSGHAFDAQGKPFPNVNVGQEVRGADFGFFGSVASGSVAPDGSFTIKNVPPGEYMLGASTGSSAAEPSAAILPITVDGTDIANLELVGSSGGTLSGQVIADDGTIPAIPRLLITVAEYARGQASPMLVGLVRNGGAAEVGSDGRFTVNGIFGRSRIRTLRLPDEWAVKAVTHGGESIAEEQIELRSGETWSDVQIVLTKTVTALTGQLVDAKGLPLADGTVVMFSTDSGKWVEDSRYVRAVRPDRQGQWQIKGAPAGEYIVVAVDAVEDGQWFEAEFLNSIRNHGQTVVLADGQSQNLQLKVVTPDQQ